jgi:hypothetical protein
MKRELTPEEEAAYAELARAAARLRKAQQRARLRTTRRATRPRVLVGKEAAHDAK